MGYPPLRQILAPRPSSRRPARRNRSIPRGEARRCRLNAPAVHVNLTAPARVPEEVQAKTATRPRRGRSRVHSYLASSSAALFRRSSSSSSRITRWWMRRACQPRQAFLMLR